MNFPFVPIQLLIRMTSEERLIPKSNNGNKDNNYTKRIEKIGDTLISGNRDGTVTIVKSKNTTTLISRQSCRQDHPLETLQATSIEIQI